jgi:hypothetical protein
MAITSPTNTAPILIDLDMAEIADIHKFASRVFAIGVSKSGAVVANIVDVAGGTVAETINFDGVDSPDQIKTCFTKEKFMICAGRGDKLKAYIFQRGHWQDPKIIPLGSILLGDPKP